MNSVLFLDPIEECVVICILYLYVGIYLHISARLVVPSTSIDKLLKHFLSHFFKILIPQLSFASQCLMLNLFNNVYLTKTYLHKAQLTDRQHITNYVCIIRHT